MLSHAMGREKTNCARVSIEEKPTGRIPRGPIYGRWMECSKIVPSR